MESMPQHPPSRSEASAVNPPSSSASLAAKSKAARKISKRAREISGTDDPLRKRSKIKAKNSKKKSTLASSVPSASLSKPSASSKSLLSSRSLQKPPSLPTSPVPTASLPRSYTIPRRAQSVSPPVPSSPPPADCSLPPATPTSLQIITIPTEEVGVEASVSEGEIRGSSQGNATITQSPLLHPQRSPGTDRRYRQQQKQPVDTESSRQRQQPLDTEDAEEDRRYRQQPLDTEYNRYRQFDFEGHRYRPHQFDPEDQRYRPAYPYGTPRRYHPGDYYADSHFPPYPPHYYEDWQRERDRELSFYYPPQYPRFRQAPSETISRPPPDVTAPAPSQPSVPRQQQSIPRQVSVPTPSVPNLAHASLSRQREAAIETESENEYRSDSSQQLSPTQSIPSPDDFVVSSDVVSPSEDLLHFSDQVQRMARSLGIELSQPIEKLNDPVYDDLYCESSTPAAIPYLPVLLRTVQQSWQLPASMPPTSKRLDSIYKIQQKSAPFLYTHPKPNSIIVEASQGRTQRRHSAPVDKEGRRLDALGRRIYSSTTLSLRVHNYQATMAKYQQFLWEKIQSLSSYLPDDQKELANMFCTEAMRLSRQQLNTARHATDCASKAMVGSIALRRHAWLRSAGLSQEARSRIEDLPFDGEGLFHASTDESMENIQKAKNTAKKMGIGQPQQQQPQRFSRFRRWTRPQQQLQQRQQFQDRPSLYQPQGQYRRQQFSGRFKQGKTKTDQNPRRRL